MNDLLPWAGLIVGAVSAYYGARNAMQERIARLEARHDALKERVEAHESRINALADRA